MAAHPILNYKLPTGKAEALYVCAMRVTPEGVFRGIEIGKGAVSPELEKILAFSGEKWGNYLVTLGYQGYFEIDFVAGTDKKVYPIEANLRRTGGTHVFETTKKLLGETWKDHYIVAKNIHPGIKTKNYSEVKKIAGKLFYDKTSQEGVIVTVTTFMPEGKIGYMVIGPTKERTLEIETEFVSMC